MRQTAIRIGISVWYLFAFYGFYAGLQPGESRMVALILMALLGFPVGLAVTLLIGSMAVHFDISIFNVHGTTAEFIVEWAGLAALSVAQWIVVIKVITQTHVDSQKVTRPNAAYNRAARP